MKKIQTIHQDLVERVQLQYGLKLSVLSDNQNTSTSTYTSAQTNNRRYAHTQANTHRDTHTQTQTLSSLKLIRPFILRKHVKKVNSFVKCTSQAIEVWDNGIWLH